VNFTLFDHLDGAVVAFVAAPAEARLDHHCAASDASQNEFALTASGVRSCPLESVSIAQRAAFEADEIRGEPSRSEGLNARCVAASYGALLGVEA